MLEPPSGFFGNGYDVGIVDRVFNEFAGEPVVETHAQVGDQAFERDVVLHVKGSVVRENAVQVVVQAQAAEPGLVNVDELHVGVAHLKSGFELVLGATQTGEIQLQCPLIHEVVVPRKGVSVIPEPIARDDGNDGAVAVEEVLDRLRHNVLRLHVLRPVQAVRIRAQVSEVARKLQFVEGRRAQCVRPHQSHALVQMRERVEFVQILLKLVRVARPRRHKFQPRLQTLRVLVDVHRQAVRQCQFVHWINSPG